MSLKRGNRRYGRFDEGRGTRFTNQSETANIVGLICETGDTFGVDRRMPPTEEGDVIAIANAGAYARVMASQYNMRPTPPEIML